jgi:leader peptidase (prepilin peptidase)/N-methyltransferase
MDFSVFNIAEIYQASPAFFYAYVVVIGLIVGSFLNVVILRLPIIEELVEVKEGDLPATLMGRSQCPCCKARLPWYVNIPVFAWIILKGKAKCCGSDIHWRYPAIEILAGAVTATLLYFFGPSVQFLVASVLAYMVIAMLVIDFEHMMLPDKLTYGVLWVSLLSSVWTTFSTPDGAIIGAIVGYSFIAFINGVFSWRTGRTGMGGGDHKLMAGLGSLAGGLAVPGMVGIGCISFIAVILLFCWKSKDKPQPFGPFLIFGFLIWTLFGPFYIL